MNKKPKILYVHGGGDIIGGLEIYMAGTLINHKRLEPHIGIVKNGECLSYLEERGITNIVKLKGGRIREIHKTIRAINNGVIYVFSNNIDIVVAHGTHAWIFAWIIGKLSGRKKVFFVHGCIEEKDFKNLLIGTGLRMKADLYIANSEFTAKSIRQYLSQNVVVNYPASDMDKFDEINEYKSRKLLRSEFRIPENAFIYAVVGRIQEWKGQDTAIKAFLEFNNTGTYLLIVGDITFESDRKYLNHLRELSGICSRIIFTGFRTDVANLMKGADVIMHSSTKPEPFGIVIVEGMLARKPVIATSLGGPAEIIDDGVNGILFNPREYKILAQNMKRLYEDEALREKLGKNAYNKALDKFTMESSIKSLESIITGVANL